MKKLFIFDAVNFLFRSYYAISHMTNSQGQSTNALYGFIRSLLKIIEEFQPDYVVAVFDGPDNKKSRKQIYEDYKSHRKSMPEDLFPQWELALAFCSIANIPTLSIPGVEADDVIGSLVQFAKHHHLETHICTSDKDLCQLVSENTFVLHAHKENLKVDEKKVKELFGVKPTQIVDYLALIGDASDNIPGVEGIGPKTATSLLEEFHSLESLLKHVDSIPGKRGELLKKGREKALLSQQLALLDCTVPIPSELSFYKNTSPNIEKLKEFYQEQHFLSLLKNLKSSKDTETLTHYTTITTLKQLKELCILLKQQTSICLDTETSELSPMKASLVGVGLGFAPGSAWYIPLNGELSKEEVLDYLRDLFSDFGLTFYGHNIKYDLHILANEGIPLPRVDFDTMLASYLLTPHIQKHDLDTLTLEHFQKVKIPIEELIGKGKQEISMIEVPIEKISSYCCEDVDYTIRLKELFVKELEEKKLKALLIEIEIPLIFTLLTMERSGIFLDLSEIKKLSHELTHKISTLTDQIHEMAGEVFNISSPKQLSHILFEKMGLAPPKKTQTGFSTAAESLEALKDKSPMIPLLLEYRLLEKLRSTYVDSLPSDINPKTGRIHCTFNQSVASTGRLSCQQPNLQNIPIRSVEGKKIREAFRPEKHGWSYLSADYSQIELRLLAHFSEDPALLKAFHSGEDVHAYTASLIFNTPLKDVTPEMRYRAKAVNFGILYGQQAFGLSQGLSIEFKEAASFIETYFQRYKQVKEYLEFCKESARLNGFSSTLTGRRRPIPEIHSKNPALRALAERLAVNTPLQGTAADLIKLAMNKIHSLWSFKKGFMVLQIHDELLFECPEEELPQITSFVKKQMEEVFNLKVPLTVDISVGKNWGVC